jgi:PiT family inorganic phosphate transporter
MPETIVVIIILAILFDISNGYNDAANAITTVVSTRVLKPAYAVLLAVLMNILGAFFNNCCRKNNW